MITCLMSAFCMEPNQERVRYDYIPRQMESCDTSFQFQPLRDWVFYSMAVIMVIVKGILYLLNGLL